MEWLDGAMSSRREELTLKLVPEKSCWARLPSAKLGLLTNVPGGGAVPGSGVVLQLTPKAAGGGAGKPVYVALGPEPAATGHLELPMELAKCLGLADMQSVYARVVDKAQRATRVVVEPASVDDWEVLELNAEYVEEHMARQMGVLCAGQSFPLWVRNQTCLKLRATSAAPAPVVVPRAGSEISVAPKPRKLPAASTEAAEKPPKQGEAARQLRAQLAADGAVPESKAKINISGLEVPGGLRTTVTAAVGVSPATAALLGLELSAESPRLLAHVSRKRPVQPSDAPGTPAPTCALPEQTFTVYAVLDESAAPGHLRMTSGLMAMLGVIPAAAVWMWPLCAASAKTIKEGWVPTEIVIHPIMEGDWMKAMQALLDASKLKSSGPKSPGAAAAAPSREATAKHLQTVLRNWLRAQCDAAPAGTSLPEGASLGPSGKDGSEGCPFASGNLMQLSVLGKALDGPPGGGGGSGVARRLRGLVAGAFSTPGSGGKGGAGDPNEVRTLYYVLRARERGLQPKQDKVALLSPSLLSAREIGVSMGNPLPPPWGETPPPAPDRPPPASGPVLVARGQDVDAPASFVDWLGGPDSPLERCLTAAVPPLSLGATPRWAAAGVPAPSGLVVCGPVGSGKTALLMLLGGTLRRAPAALAHPVYVGCSAIAGAPVTHVHKLLAGVVLDAIRHAPSVVLLDDLDRIAGKIESEPDPSGQPPASNESLVGWLCDAMDHVARNHPMVLFAASCQDAESLAAPLRAASRLGQFVNIEAPTLEHRISIIRAFLAARKLAVDEAEVRHHAQRMDGYNTSDLACFVDRAAHAALTRTATGASTRAPTAADEEGAPAARVTDDDLTIAQKGFVPAAFWSVGTQKEVHSGVDGWQDVGGLDAVRKALYEAIELPLKYVKVVARAPLRLRTGVLLYGPPGCGKTHAVRAAVAAAGIRCITVKGPELLNKYIGASEAAVRDIFVRARAASPCVMFFDEFDALAPPRGHDSTGVTDRVVNQLLTELDGFDKLEGVCVIGATSRPDLIDAALLRPGRLDRLVLCGFPEAADRVAIASALARKLPMHEGFDPAWVADQTEGCTGADIQALLASAQLNAAHEAIDATDAASRRQSDTEIGSKLVIRAEHLEAALEHLRPSLPRGERQRLEKIYGRFSDDRDALKPATPDLKAKGKLRATLA